MVKIQEKEIIINAIRVLRSRRVRPSARKIAWYVRREHLLPELVTEAVLDELVESEDVLRVEYKGATSYRVTASWVKADLVKRRPTRTKVNVMNSESTRLALRAAVEVHGVAGATKGQIVEHLTSSGQERLLSKLDLLLHREIRAGTLLRVETTQRTATVITYVVPTDSPAPPPSPPSPGTEEPEESDEIDELLDNMDEADSPQEILPIQFVKKAHNVVTLVRPTPTTKKNSQQQSVPPPSPSPPPQETISAKSDDFDQMDDNNQSGKGTEGMDFEMTGEMSLKRGMGSGKRARRGRPTLKSLALQAQTACSSSRGRPSSRRNKRAKKVFDPSEGGLQGGPGGPGRKKSATRCDVCFMNVNQHAIQEDLLVCHRCQARAHPSCLGYSEELAVKSRHGPWTCMDCKHCAVCQMDHTIGTLIFCDECDRAYHLTCHQPPIVKEKQPTGAWICFACAPQNTPNPYDCLPGLPTPRDSPVPDDESRGSSGSWDNNIYDPEIPNVTHWTVDQIMEHFNSKGFEEFTQIFKDQDIDGTALLMLTRSDVLMGLNLKLGPALKMYKQVRILQTRLPNPPLP